MHKCNELTDPKSCLSKALDKEYIFVLLGRDSAATAAIMAWIAERVRTGKNMPDDEQIHDALQAAEFMTRQAKSFDKHKPL